MDATTDITPPLKPSEAAKMLNVHPRSIPRIAGLEWVEYQGTGARPIRRVTVDSVKRLLARRTA